MSRWVMRSQLAAARNPGYRWHKCRYCGSAASILETEPEHKAVACMLCGTVQCHGNGSYCSVCHYGWLPGWSGNHGQCAYKGCTEEAVGVARKRRMCQAHIERVKVRGITLAEYVTQQLAHRDSGKGWEHWTEVA